MACTSQSAKAYVQQARLHLVRELKNLSVIVENLYEREVFTDEEVSKIQAEKDDFDKNRKILDKVIKSGEAACYELLRIIDRTRKRTLGRPPLPSERKSGAPPEDKTFDLHHWISCFSFKDDPQTAYSYLQGSRPCHRYQDKLKKKAQRISNEFWTANKNLFGGSNKSDLSYTPLVLDTEGNVSPSKIKKLKSKKSKKSRPKKLRTYIPEKKAGTSPSELLKTDKHIVLVGKAGIGKTAVTQEMLKLWAQRDDEVLDYMFYFDMRKTSDLMKDKSLEELLFSLFSEPDEDKEEVLNDMKKNSDSVTIIFDGVTDLSSSVVEGLVQRDLLPEAKIIVTCRPDDEDEELLPADSLRVEVKGFSEQSIKTYLSSTLGEEHKKVLDNLELFSLCHVPMYALMVSACCSSQDSPQPCTVTEIYINIVRFCLQKNSNRPIRTKYLDLHIRNMGNEILSLAEAAFHATEGRSVNLTDVPCTDSCVLSFLRQLVIRVCPTQTKNSYAFLHYTMQEFFAALWLFKQPGKIRDVLQQCLTREKKHMRHLIPFMCRLLSEKKPSLMEFLIPAEELKRTCDLLLWKLILLSEGQMDRVISPVLAGDQLHLPVEGKKQLFDRAVNVLQEAETKADVCFYWERPHPVCQRLCLFLSEALPYIRTDYETKTGLRVLPALQSVLQSAPSVWTIDLSERKTSILLEVLKLQPEKKPVELTGWSGEESEVRSFLQCLPHISQLSVSGRFKVSDGVKLFGNLFCAAAEREDQTGEKILETLTSVCRYRGFFPNDRYMRSYNTDSHCDFLLDLFSHVKDSETKTGLRVLPALQSVLQSAPSVWTIDLSERKTSILLEVLKLQPEKKPVELRGWSDEESEVRSFLQCLPHISQLSVSDRFEVSDGVKLFVNLFCAAAEREDQTGEKILETLTSVCRYTSFPLTDRYWMMKDDVYRKYQCSFLLDLFPLVKDYETKTGLRVLPALQSVLQSAPSVWIIDLSERKTSILLEVLKLQPEKKPVKLTGWSDEESEVRSFLQCLPYISQLRIEASDEVKLFGNLFCAAAEREDQTGEKILETLTSAWTGNWFFLDETYMDDEEQELHCSFLLDLFPLVKDYETKTGLRVLPALQSVLQSAPSVWTIDLSERKTSILLEVLKLQPEKKPVKLTGWSDEESEVRSFLQCLPYISELRFEVSDGVKFCDPQFFQRVCSSISVQSREEVKQLASLLQLLDFTLLLTGQLQRKTCRTVGTVLRLCSSNPSERKLLQVVSGVGCLLRHWEVRRLDLTEFCVPARLSAESFQQLPAFLHEIQDQDLTWSTLTKTGGDLSSCCLDWDLLHYLLQHSSAQTFTVDLRKHHFLQENFTQLLPFLDRIIFKRHSDRVKLNLLWTSIPTEKKEYILFTLDTVSQLRNLLLRFIHCCAACDVQQEAASELLRATQHRLDLSCSRSVDLSEQDEPETLCLTAEDCRAVSSILRHSSQDTQLDLRDCEVDDSGLDLLFPVLHKVRLRASKAVVLRLVSLVPVSCERDTVRRAVSLSGALGGELDL
ncbi:hypothetical protein INR49_001139, partial [Caranx melampygus]